MKKINDLLNVLMGSFIGVFVGRAAFVWWNFKTNPELYAMQSAPWHTSMLVEAALTLVLLLVCVVIKAIIKYWMNK